MTLSILCDLGETRKVFSIREGFLKRSEHSPPDLLSAWQATYLLFNFCKGFDCDTQEINRLHLARKKQKCQVQGQGGGVCLFVCCFVLFQVSKHSTTRDLEAPSVNTGTVLFLIPVRDWNSRRWLGLPASTLLSLSRTADTHLVLLCHLPTAERVSNTGCNSAAAARGVSGTSCRKP